MVSFFDEKKSERNFGIFIFITCVFALIVLYYYAGLKSFWHDELCTVSSVRVGLSFSDTVRIYLTQDNQSPLFPFIAYFWYRMLPHTEQALRTLSIILTLFGCVIVGVIGKKLYSIRFGVFSFLFILGNSSVLINGAIEFRPYSLVLLVSSLNYYFYLMRLRNENWPNVILYGITMSFLPYTQYVSVILCFGLFITDCVLIIRKRAGLRVITSYLIGALIFSPWGYAMILNFLGSFTSYWAKIPNILSIIKLGKWLVTSMALFSIGLLCLTWHLLKYVKRHEKFSTESCFLSAGIFASVFMVLVIFIYSRYVNPKGSFFVERYFFPLLPFMAFTSAYGADFIYSRLQTNKRGLIFAVVFISIFVDNSYLSAIKKHHSEAYRETAQLIQKYEAESLNGKSAIVTTDPRYVFYGWEEMNFSLYPETKSLPSYCLVKSTRVEPADYADNILVRLQAQRYDRIYFCFIHNLPSRYSYNAAILKWLHENYDFGEQEKDCKMQVLELRK